MRKLRLQMPDFSQFSWAHVLRLIQNFFTEGWYFGRDDPGSRDRLRLVTCNYTSNIIANLIGGSFWTGLLILMNADDAFIGTMTMISTSANMLQLVAPLLLEKFQKRKKILTALRAAVYFFNVVFIGITPLFPFDQQTRLLFVALGVLVVNVISAFSAPGINIWHIQSIPNNVRQGYFSLITMTVGAVVCICNLAGSTIVDMFKAADQEYLGLMLMRAIALVLVIIELKLYLNIKEYPYESSGDKFTLRDLIVKPFSNKLYLKTVLVTFLWNFSANTPSSYFTVYMLRNVEVSYSYLTLISMINVPIVLLLTPFWKKILQRFDWFKTLAFSMALYALYYVGLAFTSKATLIVYPITMLYAYFMAIGINLSFTGIPYLNMPEKNQTVFIGFYSTMANLAALLGVTFSKYFILWTEEFTLNFFGFPMVNKQYLLLITAVLVGLSGVSIFWIDKSAKRMKEAQEAAEQSA